MPRTTIYVKLECGHDTVLTQGEQFRWERDPDEKVRCHWCHTDQPVVEAIPRNFTGPTCVYCYNGHHEHCVHLDHRWGKPMGPPCHCHDTGHGDPFFMLVWAMSNPPSSPEDATRKTDIILAASVEDRVKAAELIKEKAAS